MFYKSHFRQAMVLLSFIIGGNSEKWAPELIFTGL
jgi:hypothetical protein